MNKIRVNIISGFLGSGKTTSIIRLLEQKPSDERWAILVNEFGKISIDGQILKERSVSGSVYDISGGCICCSAQSHFRENLEKIIWMGGYCRIIIEPSGLGGAEMISEIIENTPDLKRMAVICLVDLSGLDNPKLQRNMIYRTQIIKSDQIVFTKSDLFADIEKRKIQVEKFKRIFPGKSNDRSETTLSYSLLNLESPDNAKNKLPAFFNAKTESVDKSYQERHFQFSGEIVISIEKIRSFFLSHPEIIRAKGYIQSHSGWHLFNFTFSECTFETSSAKEMNEMVMITAKAGKQTFPDVQEIIDQFR